MLLFWKNCSLFHCKLTAYRYAFSGITVKFGLRAARRPSFVRLHVANPSLLWEPVFGCDICQDAKVLARSSFPNMFWYDDVFGRDFDASPRCDVLVAGFPCQPFSCEGVRGGVNDRRGHVIHRIIAYVMFQHYPNKCGGPGSGRAVQFHSRALLRSWVAELLGGQALPPSPGPNKVRSPSGSEAKL